MLENVKENIFNSSKKEENNSLSKNPSNINYRINCAISSHGHIGNRILTREIKTK